MNVQYLAILSLVLTLWGPTVYAQRMEHFIPLSADIGGTFVKTQSFGLNSWSGFLANSIRIKSGYSFLFDRRFGFLTEGGFVLNNYSFSNNNDDSYQVSHIMASVSATPYFIIPFNARLNTSLHFGISGGYIFRDDNTLNRKEDNFEVLTETRGPGNFFIRPEMGLTKRFEKGNTSLMISFQHQFINSSLPFRSQISDNNGNFIASNNGNYIAFSLRHEFKIGKLKPKTPKFIPAPPENIEFEKRKTRNIARYSTRRQYVKLYIYESSEVDEDIISLSVNGQYLLHNYQISREKKSIKIPLVSGLNTIKVYAVNEGKIPPNTGSCILKIGMKKYRFQVQTGLQKNTSIEIERL